jgi:hypothetical protein
MKFVYIAMSLKMYCMMLLSLFIHLNFDHLLIQGPGLITITGCFSPQAQTPRFHRSGPATPHNVQVRGQVTVKGRERKVITPHRKPWEEEM